MRNNLPKWSDCELAVDEGRATALQRFVYEYEPGDRTEREWRERLQAIRQEERRAVWDAAIMLIKDRFGGAANTRVVDVVATLQDAYAEAAANESREDEDDG